MNDPFIVATRIHLGKQATPPDQSKLESTLESFIKTACEISASRAVVAIDPEEKIKGYDLCTAINEALVEAHKKSKEIVDVEVLKVSPWGSFVPALNALVTNACTKSISEGIYAKTILFISAETTITKEAMSILCTHMNLEDTLVVGAALPGHNYLGSEGLETKNIDLNGRTCPWNTLCIWNLSKLKLGFPLVADGIHRSENGSPIAAGVEEFSTILMHQKLLGSECSKAKLVKVPGIEWEQLFEDENRRQWHEAKMKSKISRAEMHREALGSGKGKVIHL